MRLFGRMDPLQERWQPWLFCIPFSACVPAAILPNTPWSCRTGCSAAVTATGSTARVNKERRGQVT